MAENEPVTECEFCACKKPIKEMNQVPLRIDKTNLHQYLFAFICPECEKKGLKKTISEQVIRSFTGKAKSLNDETIFDEENKGSLLEE
jgi:hypothetical protein